MSKPYILVFCILSFSTSAEQIIRNPFQFSPSLIDHEQIEVKKIVATAPIATEQKIEIGEKKSCASWEIIKQSDSGQTIVRKGDGSLCTIQLQR